MIEAKVLCDSVGEYSPRLTSFLVVFPAFVEQELLRHRAFSFSSSSSRAVPVSKMLAEVRSDALRAAPVWWGREQKGMSAGDELGDWEPGSPSLDRLSYVTALSAAQAKWAGAARLAAMCAEEMQSLGAHKSIVNRVLAPFIHRRVVITTCEPGLMNFFGLRLDRYAQAEIRVLAEQMWRAWNDSEPKKLRKGEWHLPFVSIDEYHQALYDHRYLGRDNDECWDYEGANDQCRKASSAYCARTSFLSFMTGKRATLEENLRLYDKLVDSAPMHLSPLEHQATPDKNVGNEVDGDIWSHPELHGNLPGWIQNRKTIPGEAVAPLPEAYR